jgi:GT2 family glycosyltransferase
MSDPRQNAGQRNGDAAMPDADRAGGTRSRLKRLVPGGLRRRLTPPLGHLRAQYEPRPLGVPRSYLGATPPAAPPTVSIVVPSLNYGRYLGAALESIIGQGYPELELIVCDGGSEDETPEILDRLQRPISRVLAGADDGQGDAINRGFERSSGEILAWVNADDVLLPGTLAHVASFFCEHPEVDMVYGNRVLIDERGEDVGVWVTPPHSVESLQWFDFIPQETVFWRRQLWERAGGIDTRYEYGFDWDLFLRFHRAGAEIVRLPRFLAAFRQHEGQKTRRGHDEAQRELDSIRAEFHGRPVDLADAKVRAERLLIRAIPHHAMRLSAWRAPRRRVPVQAAPSDGNGYGSGRLPVLDHDREPVDVRRAAAVVGSHGNDRA